MAKNKKDEEKPEVHDHLKGFDIRINEFGEIISNVEVDKLNNFLDDQVDDKKLRWRQEETTDNADEEE